MLVFLGAGISMFTITENSESGVPEDAKPNGLNSYETVGFASSPFRKPRIMPPAHVPVPPTQHIPHPSPGKPVRPPPTIKNFNNSAIHKARNNNTP